MQLIERFVILMYSKGCGAACVNEARQRLFTSGSRSLENIPPTQTALFQHVKRALLQGSFFWRQATSVHQEVAYLTLVLVDGTKMTPTTGSHYGQH